MRLWKRLSARLDAAVHAVRRRWLDYAFRGMLPRNLPESSDRWVILCYNDHAVQRNAGAGLAARELMKRGWHAKALYRNIYWNDLAEPNAWISGALTRDSDPRSCRMTRPTRRAPPAFDVDLPNRRIEVDGVNIFDYVQNTFDDHYRRYGSDLADPALAGKLEQAMETAGAVVEVARRIREAADSGKKIVILANECHVLPNGILLEYFMEAGKHPNIDFYLLCQAYHKYVHGSKYGAEVILTKATSAEVWDRIYFTAEEFDRWYDRLTDESRAGIGEAAQTLSTSVQWRKLVGESAPNGVDALIQDYKNRGKPVYGMFAHVAYDRPAHDATEAFRGMDDWLRGTAECFRRIDGLLLVKPHVWELALQGTPHRPNMTVADIMGGDLPPNVVVLPANQFLAHEFAARIDAAIVWRSTAFPEMVSHGIPSLFCGPCAFYMQPLRLRPPATLDEYIQRLRDLPGTFPTEEMRRRAAATLYLFAHGRPIPVNLVTKLPDWLDHGNMIISPWEFLKFKLTGRHTAEALAQAIEIRALAAYSGKAA